MLHLLGWGGRGDHSLAVAQGGTAFLGNPPDAGCLWVHARAGVPCMLLASLCKIAACCQRKAAPKRKATPQRMCAQTCFCLAVSHRDVCDVMCAACRLDRPALRLKPRLQRTQPHVPSCRPRHQQHVAWLRSRVRRTCLGGMQGSDPGRVCCGGVRVLLACPSPPRPAPAPGVRTDVPVRVPMPPSPSPSPRHTISRIIRAAYAKDNDGSSCSLRGGERPHGRRHAAAGPRGRCRGQGQQRRDGAHARGGERLLMRHRTAAAALL